MEHVGFEPTIYGSSVRCFPTKLMFQQIFYTKVFFENGPEKTVFCKSVFSEKTLNTLILIFRR